jgi:hypothetical protein
MIAAQVSGSSLYQVEIEIDKLPEEKWKKIAEMCAKRIDSIAALAEGKFPEEFQEAFMRQGDGLFPSPKEIHMETAPARIGRPCASTSPPRSMPWARGSTQTRCCFSRWRLRDHGRSVRGYLDENAGC